MVPGSPSIAALGKEGDVCVKYSSSPLGEGKGGSRQYIKENYTTPCNGAMDWRCQVPQTWDMAEQV